MQCLGHLTNIDLSRIACVGCQELINDLLIGAAIEKAQTAHFFEKFDMMASYANYNVQVQMSLPINSIKWGKV
eukprot:15359318-Ditylum_brightwellii.AAC.1